MEGRSIESATRRTREQLMCEPICSYIAAKFRGGMLKLFCCLMRGPEYYIYEKRGTLNSDRLLAHCRDMKTAQTTLHCLLFLPLSHSLCADRLVSAIALGHCVLFIVHSLVLPPRDTFKI